MIIRTVADLIAERVLITVAPEAKVIDACAVMERADIGALAVEHDGRLVGILSERDVIRRVLCRGRRAEALTVADIMTEAPQTIAPAASLFDAWVAMMAGGFRHLPVVQGGRPVGMVSIRDIPAKYQVMAERFGSYVKPQLAAQ